MKSPLGAALGVCLALLMPLRAASATFTFNSDFTITPSDVSYDGVSIVVTNCTLTVDGPHAFSNLVIQAGGRVTHTFVANGEIEPGYPVAYFLPLVLTGTNELEFAETNAMQETVVVQDQSQTMTFTNEIDYVIGLSTSNLLTLRRTENSGIVDGTTVIVTFNAWVPPVPSGLMLTVTNDVVIEAGGVIQVSGRGYGSSSSKGRGGSAGLTLTGGGGGHGGYGGISSSNAPGGNVLASALVPNEKGGAGGHGVGGPGANGGGRVWLIAGGGIYVEGAILANGNNATNTRSGGGAGGSVWLDATVVSGGGAIMVDGGNGEPSHGGGGGGGRVLISADTNLFSGSILARGGLGAQCGGAGTVYARSGEMAGQFFVDNGGRNGAATAGPMVTGSDVVIAGAAKFVAGGFNSISSLSIGAGSQLVPMFQPQLHVAVAGDVTIQSEGRINGDGLGFGPRNGIGAGSTFLGGTAYGGGGGHGGYGASGTNASQFPSAGGNSYGSLTGPTTFGSGGGGQAAGIDHGGAGGGAIRLSVGGTLVLEGSISVAGYPAILPGGGGGSGGSVWVYAKTLTGGGWISANGGEGIAPGGGGGGGGRIALEFATNTFSGAVTAHGGGGSAWGGAGTIYLRKESFMPAQSVVIDNGGDAGTNTPLTGFTSVIGLTVRGQARATASAMSSGSVAVESGGVIVMTGTQLWTVLGNVTIQEGCWILSEGVSGGAGMGGNSGSTGGGYGGNGGFGTNDRIGGNGYGSITIPSNAGSSGAPSPGSNAGGLGGGFVWMNVTGTLQVNGTISCDGFSGRGIAGGGSGGGIRLSAMVLSGAGVISANGAEGLNGGGGGGGGRIALTYTTNLFAGILSAKGGGGYRAGGAGTIYSKRNFDSAGMLLVDNQGLAGSYTMVSNFADDLTVGSGGTVAWSGTTLRHLLVRSNGWVSGASSGSPQLGSALTMTVTSGATVEKGGIIAPLAVSGTSGQGGGTAYGTGGGHGGYGGGGSNGISGGGVYGAASNPTTPGSFGSPMYAFNSSGGQGGGTVRLLVNGPLIVNGRISCDGSNGFNNSSTVLPLGGGSGGSVWIDANSLSGNGTISTDGGAGLSGGGGGGGGRVSIQFGSNTFSGVISARGGTGFRAGGAGTVYMKAFQSPAGLLLVDNNGLGGTNTPVSLTSTDDLTVQNRGVATVLASQSVRNLTVASNGVLIVGSQPVTFTVTGNANVLTGGIISADGTGSLAGGGSGSGANTGGGAGHGGYGAPGTNSVFSGGGAYGTASQPLLLGSGGNPFSSGGKGGGALKLVVNGTLSLDGRISANGEAGQDVGTAFGKTATGGGSGGSLWLILGNLVGSGLISADGGSGMNGGGGGGGGRVAVYLNGNSPFSFNGTVSAFGGLGTNCGGAGTVYIRDNRMIAGRLVIDNRGVRGTNTPISNINIYRDDVEVSREGRAAWLADVTLRNLIIRSNAWALPLPYPLSGPSSTLLTVDNATIENGGGILADGGGYPGNQGSGSGQGSGGGGGHGGFGGANSPYGGSAYGSIQQPIYPGSGGDGSGSSFAPFGGAGGGAIRLLVQKDLVVHGRIGADGISGVMGTQSGSAKNSGGGAGGSVWLNVIGRISGAGIISANGGAGLGTGSGGGGGGRIGIYCSTNDFEGTISAWGGTGTVPGGAGTVYSASVGNLTSHLTIDNGGRYGTNTPLSSTFLPPSKPFNLTIASGAVVDSGASSLPVLTNLVVESGGLLTCLPTQSNLWVTVLGGVDVQPGGAVSVDGLGFGRGSGVGVGESVNLLGAGGGYGGIGGSSASGAAGGLTYGFQNHPMLRGSGGGAGSGPFAAGSSGGGAIRLEVGGVLNVDGHVTASGTPGLQDNSGGGSGGSILVLAGGLTGDGVIAANGGDGELSGGGGGGGGRIAIYTPSNLFAGTMSAEGAEGASFGADGTVIVASLLPMLEVISQSPTGEVLSAVSTLDIIFNSALESSSLSGEDFQLSTPSGIVAGTSLGFSRPAADRLRIHLPNFSQPGDYTLTIGPEIQDVMGQPMSEAHVGSFAISLPTVTGTITNAQGEAVAGVTIGTVSYAGVVTGFDGAYVLGFVPGDSFQVTPSAPGWLFVPSFRSYTNATASVSGEHFLAIPFTPNVNAGLEGGNLMLRWNGVSGITYQLETSTNLVDWLSWGEPIHGSNTLVELPIPVDGDPAGFFRVRAGD